MKDKRTSSLQMLRTTARHGKPGEIISERVLTRPGYSAMDRLNNLSDICLLHKTVYVLFIFLAVSVITACIAGEISYADKVCMSIEDKEVELNPGVGNNGRSPLQIYHADIAHSLVVPGITNHIIAKVIDIPILTIPQPAGIALIGSLSISLLIRFLRKRYKQLRPLADYGISFIGLLASFPVLCAVAVIIKITSRGPVFYTQERVGKDGCIFNIFKFRTMHVDAESQTGPVWSRKDDPRITRVGAILRRIHMDEIPQLINVLKGEMSIIGPRPERPYFVNRLKYEVPGYTMRLSVKPGITGLAQCRHKYDETVRDVHRKLHYDMLYIKKMCWLLDIRILWNTINVSLSR